MADLGTDSYFSYGQRLRIRSAGIIGLFHPKSKEEFVISSSNPAQSIASALSDLPLRREMRIRHPEKIPDPLGKHYKDAP